MCMHPGCARNPVPHAEPGPVPMSGAAPTLGRRPLLAAALAGVSGMALAGCNTGAGLAGSVPNLVSPEQERQMGAETWARIKAESKPSDDAGMQRALEVVGGRLLATAGEAPENWEMVVFEGEEANAFALPGGKIGVYEGIFQFMDNDAQLAAVVGHEIGHNQARHASQRISASTVTDFGVQALGAALAIGNVGYANEIAALLGAGAQYGVLMPYSRDQELEADRLGLMLMARAGYDPREAAQLWRNMSAAGGRSPEFLSTHPAPESRIRQIEALLPEAMALYPG